jgi:hypothetical protein
MHYKPNAYVGGKADTILLKSYRVEGVERFTTVLEPTVELAAGEPTISEIAVWRISTHTVELLNEIAKRNSVVRKFRGWSAR